MLEVTLNDLQARLTFMTPRSVMIAPSTLNLTVICVVLETEEEVIVRPDALTPGRRAPRADVKAVSALVALEPDRLVLL